ncbi:MAG: hypothetical protein ACXWYM_00025 [Candidatus Binatia bacterium]
MRLTAKRKTKGELAMSDGTNIEAIERRVIRKAITDILRAGCEITVVDGIDGDGEEVLTKSTVISAIMEAMFSTDSDELRVYRGDAYLGFIDFVYGNDGHDVLQDHSDKPEIEELLRGANQLADAISEGRTVSDDDFPCMEKSGNENEGGGYAQLSEGDRGR